MCGVAGFFKNDFSISFQEANNIAKKMSNSLLHRGPDSINSWSSEKDDIFLAHSRLSILDLSQNGNQPMLSHNNRYVISYNGEIYNHLSIRKKIQKKN